MKCTICQHPKRQEIDQALMAKSAHPGGLKPNLWPQYFGSAPA